MGAYAASKAAAAHLTRTLGLELAGSGVLCNLISPGSTDTPMQRQLWTAPGAEDRVIAYDPRRTAPAFRSGGSRSPPTSSTPSCSSSRTRRGTSPWRTSLDGGATLGV